MRNYGINAGYGSQSEHAFLGSDNSTGIALPQKPHSFNNWQNTPANANGTVNLNPRAFADGGTVNDDGTCFASTGSDYSLFANVIP